MQPARMQILGGGGRDTKVLTWCIAHVALSMTIFLNSKYIEEITRWSEDMNFFFEW